MEKLDLKTIRFKVENTDTLATLPSILKKTLKVLENPRVSLSDIGDFIAKDPVLTTKVLKMVNSPIYGFPGRISSVSQAVILLGLNVVKGLLLGISVFELMQKAMIGLWEHSLGCAVLSKIIAKRKSHREPEEVSIAGLLHDIGKVILILHFQPNYSEALRLAEEGQIPIIEGERKIFNTTHASAGGWVLKKWRFPATLVDTIEYHHKPDLAKFSPFETAIVHISNVLIRARGFGYGGDHILSPVNKKAWEKVGLTEEDLREVLREAEDMLEDEDFFSLE
ncbi:MAG: HDOD domain-containing protein [Syntrophorhabdaceae bacterium]|nr:HDOD domain-containing protein [Syntrophorhabdaceae bacterium]